MVPYVYIWIMEMDRETTILVLGFRDFGTLAHELCLLRDECAEALNRRRLVAAGCLSRYGSQRQVYHDT